MSENWKTGDEDGREPTGEGAGLSEMGLGEEKKGPVSATTMMLLGVFVGGMVLIWGLGVHAKPRQASAAQVAADSQVESAIAAMLGKTGKREQMKQLFKDTDQLVKLFYASPAAAGEDEELPGNPFEQGTQRPVEMGVVAAPVVSGNGVEQERLRKAADSFAGLKLQSIMVGKAMTAAMINNKLVTVGAKVGEFTVSAIEPQRVVLSLGGSKFELRPGRAGTKD